MWDIATPIIVGGHHVGNIFSGQFFFEDEPLDCEFFRSQARKYGFNEDEYIAALEKVPRLSREAVDTGMSFFMKFANMISQLSYSNIKLARSLAERDALVEALLDSEKREQTRSDELAAVLDAVPAAVWIAHDPGALKMTGNRLSYEWLRLREGANMSKAAPEGERPETYRLFKDGVEIPLSDMPVRMAASGKEVSNYEFDLVYPDGTMRHLLGNAKPLRDEQGNPHGSISAFIDITERKRAEEMLAFERSQLLSIFDGIDDAVYVTDPYTYKVLYANKAMKDKFGGELVGGICYREFQRRDSPCDFCTNPIILKEKDKPYHWEYYNPTVDRYFMIMDRIIKWPDGRDVRFEIAKDITERKRAEEALRLSNLYNRSLIEASLDPLVTIGRDGKITDVNGATELVTGYSRNDLIGTDFSDYFTEPEKAREGYQQVFIDGKVWDYPLEIRHKDGHVTPVLYNASVYRDENGEVIGVFAAARDITERKKAEEALKKVRDNLEKLVEERTKQLEKAYKSLKKSEEGLAEAQRMAHIGNWRWNIATNELFWSDEVYRIFRLSPQEFKVTYNSFLNYVHPDDRDDLINAINAGLNGSPRAVEYRIILADGEERIVNTEAEAIFYKENIPIQVKGIIQDITERKRAEKELEKVNRIRIKEIHHRIKNNLQVISSLLDLQAEKFQNREVLEAFRESQNRILSMSLIHEELYKGEGTNKLNFSAYVQKLAENLFQTYSISSKNICLLMDLEENAFFDMDTAIPLGIIVNELVSNSLKHAFNKDEEGKIRIQLCREEKNKEINKSLFSLTVSDNGKGIPEDIELKSVESLGLQLVSTLVDQLDGEIEIKREQGTEFRIIFKVAERL